MKKCMLLLLTATIPFLLPAQAVLFVSPGTNLFIKSSTIFHAAGLTLVPNSAYTLTDVTLQKNSALTHPSANNSITRSYYFNRTMPAFTGFVQVDYRMVELNGLLELLLQPNIHNGTSWQAYPSSLNDVINKNVVSTVFSSSALSEITLASVSQPLPLEWLKISAGRKSRVNEISWSTNQENDVDHFDVEYSTDSKNWSIAILNVPASNTRTVQSYRQLDLIYKPQYLLYRIAETDRDGRVSYSGAVSVAAAEEGSELSIYPNPATDRFYISSPQSAEIAAVDLFSSNGMMVRHWSAGQTVYPVTALARGVYVVFIKTKSGLLKNSRLVIR